MISVDHEVAWEQLNEIMTEGVSYLSCNVSISRISAREEKFDKNRDGKTGRTHIYFDYPRSRFITQKEFVEEYEKLLAF
jgi:hypothetical protein